MTDETTNSQVTSSASPGPVIPPSPRRPRSEEPLYQTLMMPMGVLLVYLAFVLGFLLPDSPVPQYACGGMGLVFMLTSVVLRPDGLAGLYQRTFNRLSAYLINNLVLVLAVTGIVVVLNIIAYRHSTKYDFTMQQLYSLSEQTKNELASLKDQVTATAFYPDVRGASQEAMLFQSYRRKVKELLEDYTRYSSAKFKYDIVDPMRDPATVRRYQLSENEWGTVFVESRGRKVKVARDKIFARSGPFAMGPAPFKGEEALTGALLEIRSGEKLNVYFLEGHGEKQLETDQPTGYSSLKAYLERERYGIKNLQLFRTGKVPDDCSVLIVAGPNKAFAPKEVEQIRAFLNTPGKGAVFLVDTTPVTGAKELLAEFGIDWASNIVVEPDPQLALEGNAITFVAAPKDHAITKEMIKNRMGLALHEGTFLNKLARPADKFEFTPILETVGTATWAELDMTSLQTGRVKMDPNIDKPGPLTLGWAVEIKHGPAPENKPDDPSKKDEEKKEQKRSRLVVVGDSDFPSDMIRMMFPIGGNVDMFMNSVAWCAFASEKTATIRPKDEQSSTVTLTTDQKRRILRFTALVYPLTVLMLGILVWFRRSNL